MDKRVLLTGKDVVAALCGRWLSQATQLEGLSITGVNPGSRKVEAGDLVILLNRSEGGLSDDMLMGQLSRIHDRGAVLVILEREPKTRRIPTGFPFLKVPNSLHALVDLAKYCRTRFQGKTIAVTGSVGKTTVSAMLHHHLSRQATTHFGPAKRPQTISANTPFAIAASCCEMPPDDEFGVFEVAAQPPKKASVSAYLVRPSVAVFTELCPKHLDQYKDLKTIADVKSILFEGVVPDGAAVINHDMEWFDYVHKAAVSKGVANVVTYGASEQATVRLLEYDLHAAYTDVSVSVAGTTMDYRLSLPGYHNAMNSMAVVATLAVLGLDLTICAELMSSLEPVARRSQSLIVPARDGGTFELINDAYNACPVSMRAAFALLKVKQPERDGRRIAVLGDMVTMGEHSAALHRDLARGIDKYHIDRIYTLGKDIRHFHEALPESMDGKHYAEDADRLVQHLSEDIKEGDVVLVKASGSASLNEQGVVGQLQALGER